MHRSGACLASLLILLAPTHAGPEGTVRDDPLERVAQALDQGRHWYATRLLRDLDGRDRGSPEATLLAARAEAGRGAWEAVARRLQGVAWLDSVGYGEGQALLARARLETGRYEPAAASYRTFLGYSIERLPRTLAEIGLARALEQLGQATEAAAAWARAAEYAPALEPWSAIRAAEALAAQGDTAAVRRLLDRAGDVPLYRRTLARVTGHERAGDRAGALHILLDAADAPDVGNRAADLRTRAARLQLEEADTAAARQTLRAAVRLTPRSALAAAELLSGLPGLSASDHLRLAQAFEKSGAPSQAAQEYQLYLKAVSVSTSERQRLQLKIGELLLNGGAYFAAIDELERLVASEPAPSLQAQAEYLIARATYRRGWRREGRARLREIADRYPGTTSASRALSLLGDLYESAGDVAEARAISEQLVSRYATSQAGRSARFRLGILDFMSGDFASARNHFDRLRRSERRGELQARAAYWAARARLAEAGAQRVAEADRLFRAAHASDPFGYYGLLAAERAGIDPWANLPAGPEPQPIDLETTRKFELIKLLRQAGLAEEAMTVLESILASRPRRPEALLGLSVALAERGFGEQAVRLGWSAHAQLQGHWSTSVLRAIYPLAYREIIFAESHSRRLDPSLVAAIVRQESLFTADATSRAGARGLLQLMPQTGRWWAGRLGVKDYSLEILYHPEINVHLGTAYLADLQRRYGELQLALIAYNAGPTRARRWQRRPEYQIDAELFAERIPFAETRGYVRGVQTQHRIYRQLYTEIWQGEAAE